MRAATRRPAPARFVALLGAIAFAMVLLGSPAERILAQNAAGPKVTAGPTIVSSPQSGDTYRAGEAITVTLTYDEPVTVTGKPRLRLTMGDERRWAGYESADGATLSFTHTVKPGDVDTDGISTGRNQLKLNGGTIEDADGNAANLKHPPLRRQEGHRVNGAPDVPEPEPTPEPAPEPEPPANNQPRFAGETAARSVSENTAAGEHVGAAITAADDDGDALTYALGGADAAAFDLDAASGQITVRDALDYESKASYAVTVNVHDGKNAAGEADDSVDAAITVTVTVLNVDEAGTVVLDTDAPQAGSELTASVTDPDGGVTGLTWAWERSADGSAWSAIAGATGASYTPANDDAGHYLRATASYDDGQGPDKTARTATTGTVAAVVAAVVDGPPAIVQGPILKSPRSGGVYGAGEEIVVSLTFSEPVTVSGKPRLGVIVGENRRWAKYSESVAGGATLVFVYTVQAADRDGDGIRIRKNALRLNGGTIEDAGGAAAGLDHAAVAALPSHRVDGAAAPSNLAPQFAADTAARSVAADATAGANVGDPVTATDGDGDGDTLTYALSGADAAAFDVDAASGQITVKGELDFEAKASYSVTVSVHDGKNAAGEADATVDDAIAVTISVAIVDEPPSVTAGPILNSPADGDTYRAGESVLVTLTFSEPVTVSGLPYLGIVIGEDRRWAAYDRTVAGGATLVFSYVVRADDRDADGLSIGANSMELNDGTITDAGGNNANLEHPAWATPSTHRVDGSAAIKGEPQTAPSAVTVPASSPLIPDTLPVWRNSFRLLFVTSGEIYATSSDIGTYNTFVQGNADASADEEKKYQGAYANLLLRPFKDGFRVVGSTASVHAIDNTATRWSSGNKFWPIFWLNGDKVADNYELFYDGSWDSYSSKNELGEDFSPGDRVYTGTINDGRKHTGNPQYTLGSTQVLLGQLVDGSVLDKGKVDRPAGEKRVQNSLYALSPVINIDPSSTVVPANSPLIPTDSDGNPRIGVGGRFRVLFVTSGTTTGTSSRIGDYNTFVREEAAKSLALGAFSHRFTAIGSTDTVDARDNTGTTYTEADKGVPIYWVNGDQVADNYEDLYDDTWDSVAGRDQNGYLSTHCLIWSGSNRNGTKEDQSAFRLGGASPSPGKLTCLDADTAGKHALDFAAGRWAIIPNTNVRQYSPLYALSPVLTVGAYMEVPDDWPYIPRNSSGDPMFGNGQSFRLMFVTSSSHTVNSSNPADYSTVVRDRAGENEILAPHRNGFLAFLSTRTVHARDYTHTNPSSDGAGEPIYWLNGARVADNYSDFYCGGGWDSQVARFETGAKVTGLADRYIWTGSNCDGTPRSNRWIGAQDAAVGKLAGDNGGASKEIDTGFTQSKSSPHALYGMSVRLVVRKAADIETPSSHVVPPNWPLIPSGLNTGDQFRLLFITRDGRNARSTDIGDYNAHVQSEAKKNPNLAAYGSRFRVVASTARVAARDNAAGVADTRIYWVGGDKVADNAADFYDNSWDSYAARDQHGASYTPDLIYTGSNADGTPYQTSQYKSSLGDANAAIGKLSNDKVMFSGTQLSTPTLSPFYALSPVFTVGKVMTAPANWLYVPENTEPGESFRLMFVTSSKSQGGGVNQVTYINTVRDRAAEDAFLKPYKAGFGALVSTPFHDARDLTFTNVGLGEPIHWVGGEKVADNYADFYDGSWDSHAATNEHGVLYPAKGEVVGSIWTGSNSNGTKKTNSWMSADWVTIGELTDGKEIDSGSEGSKGSAKRLYALSNRIRVGPAASAPAKPAGFEAAAGNATVGLRWTNPNDDTIARYQYRQKTTGAYGPWTDIPDSDEDTASHIVKGLTNGTAYTFRVRAVNAGAIASPASDEKSATPDAAGASIPAKPTGLSATAGNREITLSWTNPTDTGITGYEYRQKKGSGSYGDWMAIAGSGAATTMHIVTNLEAKTPYTFKIRAVNAVGSSEASDEATATTLDPTPLAPKNLRATPGSARVTLAWDKHSDSSITSYQYQQKSGTGSFPTTWTNIPNSDKDTVSYAVTGLTDGTEYTFRLRAVNAIGNGTLSDEVSATPGAITVTTDWALLPPGLEVGDTFRLLFLTSSRGDAQSTDIATYNARVQAAANSIDALKPFKNEFRALASTATTDARDNTATGPANGSAYATGEGLPIYWAGGAKIADDYAGFYPSTAGGTVAPRDESGKPHPRASMLGSIRVWTGSTTSGTKDTGKELGASAVQLGTMDRANMMYSNSTDSKTSNPGHHLYGLSPALTVVAAPDQTAPAGQTVSSDWAHVPTGISTGESFRLLFITSTRRDAQVAGIDNYNAFVQELAKTNTNLAGFSSEFRALVSTEYRDARDNTATTYTNDDKGVPIYWIGGAKIADDYEGFYDGSWDAVERKVESGSDSSRAQNSIRVWTGSTSSGMKDASKELGASAVQLGKLTANAEIYSNSTDSRSASPGHHVYGLSPVLTTTDVPIAVNPPSAPTSLSATAGESSVTLNWDDPGDNTISKYQYQQKQGSASYGGWNDITGSTSNTTSYTVSGLSPASEYSFKVRAVNAIGPGGASNEASATPVPPASLNGLSVVRPDLRESRGRVWVEIRPQLGTTRASDLRVTMTVTPVAPATEDDFTIYAGTEVIIRAGQPASENGLIIYPVDDLKDGPQFKALTVTGKSGNETFGPVTVRIWDDEPRPGNPGALDVHQSSPLIPRDAQNNLLVKPGESFRLMFATSDKTQATSDDINHYNRVVQGAANRNSAIAGFRGRFRALVSTLTVDASENTWSDYAWSDSDTSIYWVGGAKVADSYDDFYADRGGFGDSIRWHSLDARKETGAAYDKTAPVFTGSLGTGQANLEHYAGAKQVAVGDFTGTLTEAGSIRDSDGYIHPLARQLKPAAERYSILGLSPVLNVVQQPTVTLHLSSASIAEDGGVTTLIARQDRISPNDTTLEVEITALQTSPGVGFTPEAPVTVAPRRTLTIPTGSLKSSETLTLTSIDDEIHWPNKRVRIRIKSGTLQNRHVGALAGPNVMLTIRDNDPLPKMTLQFLDPSGNPMDEARISENGGRARVKVSLDRVSSARIWYRLRASICPVDTVGNDCPEFERFLEDGDRSNFPIGSSGLRIFMPPGMTEFTTTGIPNPLFIRAIDNNVYGPPERTAKVFVDSLTGGNGIAAPEEIQITIVDDEEPPIFRLELDPASIAEDGYLARVYGRLLPGKSPGREVKIKLSLEPLPATSAKAGDAVFRNVSTGGDTLTRTTRGSGRFDYVLIDPVNNDKNELDKQFRVTAEFLDYHASMGSLPEPVILTIRDDDEGPGPRPLLKLSTQTIGKAGGKVEVTAELDTVAGEDTTVRISLLEDRQLTRTTSEQVPSDRATFKDGVVEIVIPAGELEGSNTVTLNIKPDPNADGVRLVVRGDVTSDGWAAGNYRVGLLMGE